MDFGREGLDASAHVLGEPGPFGVRPKQFEELRGLLRGERLSLGTGCRQRFSVLCIGVGVGLVAVCLPGLGEQDERGRVGRLEAECEVEQNKRVEVEPRDTRCEALARGASVGLWGAACPNLSWGGTP
jgi:hypothetical protein